MMMIPYRTSLFNQASRSGIRRVVKAVWLKFGWVGCGDRLRYSAQLSTAQARCARPRSPRVKLGLDQFSNSAVD